MKVILTQDVEKLGHAMDVVEVADGFARNYLLPRSLAMSATKSAMSSLDNLRKIEEKKQAKLKTGAEGVASKLAGETVMFTDAHVGTGGKLYGAVTAANVSDAIKTQFGVEVDRRDVLLEEPIRAEGFYYVPLKLHRDITIEQRVQVGNPPAEVEESSDVPAETETSAEAVAA